MSGAAYDEIADWYDQVVREGGLLHALALPALFDLLGAVDGRAVCDLACGQGIVARALAERGARVVGVDLSAGLLEIARREEAARPLGIAYHQGDAQALEEMGDASVDDVVCNMALMDIPDLDAVAATVARLLRPGGRFVFVITHPCFQAPGAWTAAAADGSTYRAVPTYLAEGYWRSENAAGVRGQVGAHHRTLGTYLNALTAAGLRLERLTEPAASGALAERQPDATSIPLLLAARWRRSGDAAQRAGSS